MANINPYESPQVVESEVPPPGIGTWQDRELMVMHVSATLPSICIKTGKRAELHPDVTIRWVQNYVPWRLTMQVPLSWTAFRTVMMVPVLVFVGTLGLTAALVGVLSLFNEEPISLILLIAVLAVATIVVGLRALNTLGKVLRVRHSRGKYLWLSGAGFEFLEQLPKWEGLDVD